MNEENKIEKGTPLVDGKYAVVINKEGPYCIYGNPPLGQVTIITNEAGEAWDYQEGKTFDMQDEPVHLCRCGESKRKPYCDGAHLHADWKPELTAKNTPLLDEAEVFDGPKHQLTDNSEYCIHAGICMAKNTAWKAVKRSDDPEKEEILKHEVFRCPSGRLKIIDKETGEFIEPDLKPSLSLIEDPKKNCSGPLWVMGGIPLEDGSGVQYETRNRVTLCRCGKSYNKPFCDGAHIEEKFQDGL